MTDDTDLAVYDGLSAKCLEHSTSVNAKQEQKGKAEGDVNLKVVHKNEGRDVLVSGGRRHARGLERVLDQVRDMITASRERCHFLPCRRSFPLLSSRHLEAHD